MKNRFFAFGCSYTQYSYATWADFVGINFTEYYNYGRGGASNTFIMNRIVEVDELLKFNNKTDTIIVMLSGIGRYSYFRNHAWITNGDLYSYYEHSKDKVVKQFIDNMYSEEWAVYQSWIAIKTIKKILTDIPHKIFMAIDNSNYLLEDGSKWGSNQKLSSNIINYVKEIYNLLDDQESMDEWMKSNYEKEDHIVWKNNNSLDGHPTQLMHFNFVKSKLPNYINPKSIDLLNLVESIFNDSSQKACADFFRIHTQEKLNKRYPVRLFGDS